VLPILQVSPKRGVPPLLRNSRHGPPRAGFRLLGRERPPIRPYNWDKGENVVEKADERGVKRRYLGGIPSGIFKDGQGELIPEARDREARRADLWRHGAIAAIITALEAGIYAAVKWGEAAASLSPGSGKRTCPAPP